MDFNFGQDNGQEREPVNILGEELQRVNNLSIYWRRQETWQHKLHREWVQHGETGGDAVECCVTGK